MTTLGLSNDELTALGNALWGGSSLAMCGLTWGMIRFYGGKISAGTKASMLWISGALFCVVIHRTFWNFAIWLGGPGTSDYAKSITDYKHWTLLLVVGICFCSYKAAVPFLSGVNVRRYTYGLVAWLILSGSIAIWLA